MKVNFDLSSLSEGILEEHRQAMAAMQSAIPALASQVEKWLTEERDRRQKAASKRRGGQTSGAVGVVLEA